MTINQHQRRLVKQSILSQQQNSRSVFFPNCLTSHQLALPRIFYLPSKFLLAVLTFQSSAKQKLFKSNSPENERLNRWSRCVLCALKISMCLLTGIKPLGWGIAVRTFKGVQPIRSRGNLRPPFTDAVLIVGVKP